MIPIQRFINKIIHGDCLEVLKQIPSNSVDAVITDPPYSSGGLYQSQKAQDPIAKYCQDGTKIVRPSFPGDCKDTRSWLHWCVLWIAECHRIVKENGYFLMFSDWRQIPTASDALQFGDFIWRGVVVWDKTEGARAPHKGYFKHQAEYILWGTKKACKKAIHAGPFPGCYRFSVKQSDKFHLTGKPTPLLEQLVQIVPEGGIVLDPFAGSGTLAVAAKNTNRNYIAIEKALEYVEISHARTNP